MEKVVRYLGAVLIALIVVVSVFSSAHADILSGYGQLSGDVTGSQPGVLPVVYAYNPEKDVGYTVFVINGKYRAVNLIPGPYYVELRPAVEQLESFTTKYTKVNVVADAHVTADFTVEGINNAPNYVNGTDYPDARIEPYNVIYPPGPGRDIIERACHGCHTVNFFPYNRVRAYPAGRVPHDEFSWPVTVDRMHKGPAFGIPGKATLFDPAFLPPADRDILVDYLIKNFGADSEPRVVQLMSEAALDEDALKKAQFIDYIYHESEEYADPYLRTNPWPHQVDFDADGNVWLAYTACCIVRFDPRTGESKAYEGHGGGHGVVVDQTDGTVWYSGSGDVVRRLDPETAEVDYWKIGETTTSSNTQIFDTKGNLWMSLLGLGGIAKWDRKTDSLLYWENPIVRSRPYGIIVDRTDKVWWADYHNGGISRFDPETEQFKFFKLVSDEAATAIRRLGVDSKNMIWTATWGSRGHQNAAVYRLNPETGEVMERKVDIEYTNPYNAEVDADDNVWLAPDNYLSKYDPKADKFTHYPIPTRSDSLKTTISANGGIWFIYRNAGKFAGFGGNATVLYPDKDKITTLAAYHSKDSPGYFLSKYSGPLAPKVKGEIRTGSERAQNADAYADWVKTKGTDELGALID